MSAWVAWTGRALGLVSLGVLTACDQHGFSGRDAEWDRRNAGPYYVVRAAPERAVVSALGRQVAIKPAKGFCVAEDSLETSGRSAFALIGDCVLEDGGQEGPRDSRGALQLPLGVPGIITVSISGDPGFGTGSGFRDNIEAFIESSQGSSLLGRSAAAPVVKVLEQRYIGEAVYVLIEDGGDPLVPVLEPQFWRAFTTLNDRLAVVTASGFNLHPLGKEEMLEHLMNQVATLTVANANPIFEEPDTQFARRERPTRATLPISEIEPESIVIASTQTGDEPEVSTGSDIPEPPSRPAVASADPAETDAEPAVAAFEIVADEPTTEVVAVAPTDAVAPVPPASPAASEAEAEVAPDVEEVAEPATPNAPEEAPEAPPRPSRT